MNDELNKQSVSQKTQNNSHNSEKNNSNIVICQDCGHKGVAKKRIQGIAFTLIVPAIFVAIILTFVNPIISIIFLGSAYYFSRRKTCEICGSENTILDTPEGNVNANKSLAEWGSSATTRSAQMVKEAYNDHKTSKNIIEQRKNKIIRRSLHKPIEISILGGFGWDNKKGEVFWLSINEKEIFLNKIDSDFELQININNISEIDINGPGTTVTNAGISGGGFGLEGAATGMAAATVINLLTTNIKTKTYIYLKYNESEVIMLTDGLEPQGARIMFSGAYASLSNNQKISSPSLADEFKKLHSLLEQGILSNDEFAEAKNSLLKR